jgi:hypothetical protein
VVFDTTDGDRCAIVVEAKMARKYTAWQMVPMLKLAVDDTRSSFENDPELSEINPMVDFSTLKRYQLRWIDRPAVSDGFEPNVQRIPREQWEMMLVISKSSCVKYS